ncbi:MAG: radical SAM protein [Candidatus Omnitrophota bacterium]
MSVDYLRLSITDRCNLNCIYCTPLEKEQFLTHSQVLRYEEMVRIAELFVKAGIKKIRITGGGTFGKKGDS